MKRIDPHHGLNGECQGAPSRHPMFRGSIPRLNMGGASPRGAFPRSALASERLVSERSGSSEQPDRGRPFGCPAFDPRPCPKRSESLSARRTCRRCTCQLVDFFLANSLRGKRQPTPPFFLFSEMRGAPYFLFSKNAEKRWRGCRWRASRQNSSNNMTSSTTTTQTTKIICHLQER